MKVIFTKKPLLNMVRLFPSFSLFLAFLMIPFSSSFAQECEASSTDFGYYGNYNVELAGVEHDFPEEGQSTWFYTVTNRCGYSIRNVSFPLNNDCVDVVDAGMWGDEFTDLYSGYGNPRVRNSCWSGYRVKFRKRIRRYKSKNFYFTIDKNLEVEPLSQIYMRVGCYYLQGTVCGPSIECNEKEEVTPPPPPPAPESCISGLAFHDKNVNGTRDTDEPIIEGVTVKLRTSTGSIVTQAATDTDGKYSFCGLDPGSYIVQMEASFDYLLTQSNIGSDDLDNDLEGSSAMTSVLTINEIGDSFTNIDGGYFKFVDFDNQAFVVQNNNPNSLNTGKSNATTTIGSTAVNTNPTTPNVMRGMEGTGQNTTQVEVEVKVFPNPVVNTATIKVANNDDGEVRIEIRSQSNQLLKTTRLAQYETEQSVDFSNFPKGAYFIYFITDAGVKVKTIIKN